jgi:hypothetical protein
MMLQFPAYPGLAALDVNVEADLIGEAVVAQRKHEPSILCPN